MNRPYIICHILSALDGKIAGEFMKTTANQNASNEYGRIRKEFNAQAWLYGTTTTKEFTGLRKPILEPLSEEISDSDYVAETGWDLYYVSLDTLGEIAWDSGTYKRAGRPDSHVIEILTEKTPQEYRAYLRKQGVSYIIAGRDTLDCQLAAQKLKELFGIEKVLICGAPTVFERMEQLGKSNPIVFHLKNISQLQNDIVHLTYITENQED